METTETPETLEQQNPTKTVAEHNAEQTGIMKWLPLLVISLALTIIILDTTILNVTLRTIIVDLHTNIQSIQWVITGYSLIIAAFTITGGRMGDLFGRKKMFVLGAIIFAIGSFMTSIAHSVSFMIAGEAVIEGLGACLMLPATQSLLRSNYKGRDLQVAFGIWGGIIAGAAAIGPLIGGWFTSHYSWRWAFRVNVVVAAILVLSSVVIKEYRDLSEKKKDIDFVGVILSALSMTAIVFGFVQTSTYGWWKAVAPLTILHNTISFGSLSASPVFIAVGLLIGWAFIAWESHVEKIGKTPLASVSLFKSSGFVVGSSISSIQALGMAGLTFAIPIYLQAVLKLTPIQTGLALVPMSLPILIAAPLSAWISKHVTPKHIIQVGIVMNIVGFIVLRQSLHVGVNQWAMAPGLIVFGLGLGLIFAQATNLTLSAVPVDQAGEAAGVSSTLRSLGQTLGAAILGAVLISALGSNLTSGVNASTAIPQSDKAAVVQVVASQSSSIEFGSGPNFAGTGISQSTAGTITSITDQATVSATRESFAYGAAFMVLGLAVSFALPSGVDEEDLSPAVAEADAAVEGSTGSAPESMPTAQPIAVATAAVLVEADGMPEKEKEKVLSTQPKVEPRVAPVQQPHISQPQPKSASVIVTHEDKSDGRAVGAGVFALVLIAAGLVIGFFWGRHTAPELVVTEPVPQAITQIVPNGQPQVLGAATTVPTPTPTATPTPVPTLTAAPVTIRDFSDAAEEYSVQIPSNWTTTQVDGEDVFITPGNQRFSVQMYRVNTNDTSQLGGFLQSQPNLYNVSQSVVTGRSAFAFGVDGIYGHGYAFLDSGRLYYLLGTGVENSPIAGTFQVAN